MTRHIVNIVNFIRDVEPRGPVNLVEPVRELVLRYQGTDYGLALNAGTFDGPTAVRSETGTADFIIIRK